MKVTEVDLRFDMEKRIKIIKIKNPDDRKFEGMTGNITNPFGEFAVTDVGVFLDNPFMNCDTVNLTKDDEVEFIEEF